MDLQTCTCAQVPPKTAELPAYKATTLDPNGSVCYRKAWKRAALETHPDKTGESEPFIRVSQAYTLLLGAC